MVFLTARTGVFAGGPSRRAASRKIEAMRFLGCLAIALALSAATIPPPASAATPPGRPYPHAVLRAAAGVSVPIVHLNQPGGVGCVAVKINSGSSVVPWWGVVNCNNGLAYSYKASPTAIVLGLPPGATSEQAYDIDFNGYVVGVAYNGAGTAMPMVWNPAGAPVAGPFGPCVPGFAPTGIAAGIYKTGWPGANVVGENLAGAPSQACWWSPGPHVIPPPPNQSFAYDVNTKPIYVGQLNGVAAAGVGPGGALAAIAGVSGQSVAYAINTGSWIVGHQDFGPGCTGFTGNAFMLPYGGGAAPVGPLPGDCNAGLEDLNDSQAAVGYSAQPGLKQAMGYQLLAPYPAGLFNLNTGVAPHPWALLSDAPGIDDAGDIIATDTGVAPSQVYVLI
jgi:hypothetical protein